ncbi:type III secretion system transcriptional regulator ExsA [Vibrio parahaemolyticus]|uniref:type III secretion system transcriptional regulator ExsA n=1 Tax=Vibrio parahaemolyticus TaxID=670 RepID=UPI00084B9BEB|nr:type III secretion system transcriptional regulator ExsA [Vibrio parahaemolyticus]ELA8096036.1 type III secretion system transcriptional regulator ExsA [Vibrio parahaemolyticus]MDF4342127.1 type III secretion system transcriptional regulator ExsA [Vibrio parahaemolyticus]MDF4415235.1 type III secretion system transcriptional regulator ExsA [Vibrio parahaemolyticus]MDF4523112.1 type III secretion system transcriptional regulator ExsA [Vibrio parahaemolyticus]MDF4551458.1 type III secretion s
MDVSGQLNTETVGSSLRKIRSFSHYEKHDEVFHSDQSHIVVVHNGQLRVQTGDCTIDVVTGSGVFLSQGDYLLEYSPQGGNYHSSIIEFDNELVSQLLQKHSDLLMTLPKVDKLNSGLFSFGLNILIEQVLSGMKTLEEQSYPDAIMRLKYEEMLILLLHSQGGEVLYALLSQQTNRTSDRLRRFMEQHYLKEWKLTDYAQEFGASLTTFKELFNEHYGISPRAWISERRLLHAHKLLLTSKMSIVDVAMEAGFSSQSYFTQSYRRRFGTTPSKVRSGDEQVAIAN